MIRVVFFASIREALGKDQVEIDEEGLGTVQDLIARLGDQEGDSWQDVLAGENLLVAVNQTMVDLHQPISAGDEVAFFPPVTGG